jgi:hypothetical protein
MLMAAACFPFVIFLLLCCTYRCLDSNTLKAVLAEVAQYKAAGMPLLQHYADKGVLKTIASTSSGTLYSNVRAHFAAQLPAVTATYQARSNSTSVGSVVRHTARGAVQGFADGFTSAAVQACCSSVRAGSNSSGTVSGTVERNTAQGVADTIAVAVDGGIDLLRASRSDRDRQQQQQLAEQPLDQELSDSAGGEQVCAEPGSDYWAEVANSCGSSSDGVTSGWDIGFPDIMPNSFPDLW